MQLRLNPVKIQLSDKLCKDLILFTCPEHLLKGKSEELHYRKANQSGNHPQEQF